MCYGGFKGGLANALLQLIKRNERSVERDRRIILRVLEFVVYKRHGDGDGDGDALGDAQGGDSLRAMQLQLA